VQFFKTNAERIRSDNSVNVSISLFERLIDNPRWYNRPTASLVVALIPTTVESGATHWQIILQNRADNALTFISEAHLLYLSSRYPFLYPYREAGWHFNLLLGNRPYKSNAQARIAEERAHEEERAALGAQGIAQRERVPNFEI